MTPFTFVPVATLALYGLICGLLTFSYSATAAVTLEKPLPAIAIEEKGEAVLQGDKVIYQPWKLEITGRPQVIQHMAATLKVRNLNKPFQDKLQASGINLDGYDTISLVNVKEAMLGTKGMVFGQVKKNKKKFDYSTIVADKHGLAKKAWGLKKKTACVILVDRDGNVLFFKEGALNATEITHVIETLRSIVDG